MRFMFVLLLLLTSCADSEDSASQDGAVPCTNGAVTIAGMEPVLAWEYMDIPSEDGTPPVRYVRWFLSGQATDGWTTITCDSGYMVLWTTIQ